MNIFISWSGHESREVAEVMMKWLPKVIKAANPWMSKEIPCGENPFEAINRELREAKFGIICITTENQANGWMNFEAGAMYSRNIAVCPYIIDLNLHRGDLPGALSQMQGQLADEEGTRKLLRDINKALNGKLKENDLEEAMKHYWKELEEELERIRTKYEGGGDGEKYYEKIVKDFIETFMDINNHRESLKFAGIINHTLKAFANNEYDRESIIEMVSLKVKENRDGFDRKSLIVGCVRDFFKQHFTRDDIEEIIDNLEEVLKRETDPDTKQRRLREFVEREKLEAFLRFHQLLVDKLRALLR
jgi:DNA-binding transcriptional regulator GbsR (MarR family)